jgi:hypothetical protein
MSCERWRRLPSTKQQTAITAMERVKLFASTGARMALSRLARVRFGSRRLLENRESDPRKISLLFSLQLRFGFVLCFRHDQMSRIAAEGNSKFKLTHYRKDVRLSSADQHFDFSFAVK